MDNYLLSIFPLRNFAGRARVYMMPISETAIPLAPPLVVSCQDLLALLERTSIAGASTHVLEMLHEDDFVQITIHGEDARLIAAAGTEPTCGDVKRGQFFEK